MKTKDIPEAEATKLRLIRDLPFPTQVPIDRIISTAVDWDTAQYGIDMYLTALINGIENIKSVRDKFKLPGSIGELRTDYEEREKRKKALNTPK